MSARSLGLNRGPKVAVIYASGVIAEGGALSRFLRVPSAGGKYELVEIDRLALHDGPVDAADD